MEIEAMDGSAEVLRDHRRAQDEFTLQLVDALAPPVLQGFRAILDSAVKLCHDQGEDEKYLMTFQNMLARIPGWNASVIAAEVERITEATQIGYLPDLVTGVHIIHLRILSSVRVGHKPKRIEIDPPDFDQFVHRVYCEAGRKMWTYTYLFRTDVTDLELQQNMHECEKIIRDCVVSAVRTSMPIETVLRAYIDEAEEISLSEPSAGVPSAATPGEDDGQGKEATAKASTDVEAEVKRITAPALDQGDLQEGGNGAGAGSAAAGAGAAEDDVAGGDDVPPTAEAAGTEEPVRPLSVGFAEKNEVLDMGTNRTAQVAMAPGTRSPLPLPGPAPQEVTVADLVSGGGALAPPRALNLATQPPPPLAPKAVEEVTFDIIPAGNRPTLRLDTSGWD